MSEQATLPTYSGELVIHTSTRWRRAVVACALVIGVAALSACAEEYDRLEAPPGWEEPGWMAQVRQQNEEYRSAIQSCYSEYGLESTPLMGGSSLGFMNLPADPATEQLIEEASADCNSRVPLPDNEQNQVLTDAGYARMLETRECMIAYGYEIPEPPSAQMWKDSDPWDTAWNPYEVLIGPEALEITDDDLRALNEACPQPGPNFRVQAPSPNE